MDADPRDEVPCGMCGHKGSLHVRYVPNARGGGYKQVTGAKRYGGCSHNHGIPGMFCKCEQYIDPPKSAGPPPNCHACAHSYMEPDDDLTCGHPDSGSMGLYTHHAAGAGGHCGVSRTKFAQHPGRNPDGTLK